jgi:Thiamine pyrophosphate enzyme, central domain
MGSPTIGDLLRDVSPELARAFDDVPVPAALDFALHRGETFALATVGLRWPHGSERTAVVAGPDVLRVPGAIEGVRRFAATANVPVANTWGAKGVLNWDSPHHMGTCGLQADDFALLGLADYDRIVATGIDPLESPEERFGLAPVVHVEPGSFWHFIDVPRMNDQIPANELYARIAGVAQPGYVDESFPRHPARAVMDLKQSLGPATIVFGQPGPAGLWLARTFPTDRPGSICVPSVSKPGIAAALALAATLQGMDAVAVTTDPVDEATRAVLDAAPEAIRIETWGDDVDWSRTKDLIEAAGPVVAWT